MTAVRSLPYLNSAPDPHGDESGILIYDSNRTYEGYTLYSPRTKACAFLIEMDGRVAWEWRGAENDEPWQHVQLLPDGSLLVIVKDKYLQRLDVNSQILWRREMRAHHDLSVDGATLWVLDREDLVVPSIHRSNPVVADKITLVDLNSGQKIRDINLIELLLNSPYRFLLPELSRKTFDNNDVLDIIHTNHVEVLDGGPGANLDPFHGGDVLISMRNINTIAVFQPEDMSVKWIWGPSNLSYQHHPTLLGNGNLLIFDNGTKQSRVLELNPATQTVEWEFTDEGFFSRLRGSVQRLPNGNTLITESDTGHVFEVTATGDRVWEFANPHMDDQGGRAAVWRATRFAPSEISWK